MPLGSLPSSVPAPWLTSIAIEIIPRAERLWADVRCMIGYSSHWDEPEWLALSLVGCPFTLYEIACDIMTSVVQDGDQFIFTRRAGSSWAGAHLSYSILLNANAATLDSYMRPIIVPSDLPSIIDHTDHERPLPEISVIIDEMVSNLFAVSIVQRLGTGLRHPQTVWTAIVDSPTIVGVEGGITVLGAGHATSALPSEEVRKRSLLEVSKISQGLTRCLATFEIDTVVLVQEEELHANHPWYGALLRIDELEEHDHLARGMGVAEELASIWCGTGWQFGGTDSKWISWAFQAAIALQVANQQESPRHLLSRNRLKAMSRGTGWKRFGPEQRRQRAGAALALRLDAHWSAKGQGLLQSWVQEFWGLRISPMRVLQRIGLNSLTDAL